MRPFLPVLISLLRQGAWYRCKIISVHVLGMLLMVMYLQSFVQARAPFRRSLHSTQGASQKQEHML
jgi:hypothetical protein